MGSLHLLNETMVDEYVDGTYRDPMIRSHVRNCSDCQAMVRDNRLMRLLLGQSTGKSSKNHIDSQTMAVFCEDRLTDQKTLKVMDHLSQCDDCLAEYKALHDILVEEPMQVSEQQVQLALQVFDIKSHPPGSILGKLLLRRARNGYALAFDRMHNFAETMLSVQEYIIPEKNYDTMDWNSTIRSKRLESPLPSPEILPKSEKAYYSGSAAGETPRRPNKEPASRSAKRLVDIDLPTGTLSIALKNTSNASNLLLWIDTHDGAQTSEDATAQSNLAVTVITLAGEETFTGSLDNPLSVNISADAICIQIESDALDESIELDLDLTQL